VAVWSVLCGCSRDVRLAGRAVRSVTVGTKTHYGTTLDAAASPERVAYVLLRAIRDDVDARGPTERDAALDVQFDLAAVNAIQRSNRTKMDPEEFLYNVVYRWAPTVSHYGRDFETEWDKAKGRMSVSHPPKEKEEANAQPRCEVRMVVNDPNGDPNARAVMVIWMAQDSGFWRVTHLGFDPTRRELGVTSGG
jgi:hypothetical protein